MTRMDKVLARGATRSPVRASANDGDAPSYAHVLARAPMRDGVWVADASGRRWLDLCNADGAVILGWNDERLEAAVAAVGAQEPEARAAGRLAALTPNACAVAFEVSVSSAMAGVLLAAKAATGRDGAWFCDEAASIAGDVVAMEQVLGERAAEVAAIVVRPLDAAPGFLKAVRAVADRLGAVLVFEESRSAFRVHCGGAQGLHGVRADAVIYGASLANGRRLAAVAGTSELMSAYRRQGAGPDKASLAAADHLLSRAMNEDLSRQLQVTGAELMAEVEARLVRTGADAFVSLHGDPSWSVISGDPAFETELVRALAHEGVLSEGAHVVSAGLDQAAMGRLLKAYDRALPRLVDDFGLVRLRAG